MQESILKGYRVRTGVVGGGESKKGMLEAKRDYEIMVRGGNCKIPNEEGGDRAIWKPAEDYINTYNHV